MSGREKAEDETLGARVRRLRTERGMSLARVAGGDFSRAFLSQVELDKSRPSVRVLRVISERLQAPVHYLLDGSTPSLDREIALERARLELTRGDLPRALASLEPALDSVEWPLGVDARLCAGEAMRGLGRDAEATSMLEAQRKEIIAHGDGYRLARLDAILAGREHHLGAEAHATLGSDLLRDGRAEAALEHLRAARILLGG